MINEIGVKATLELLDEIVAEFPTDYKVNTCTYIVPTTSADYIVGEITPACIVGQAVFKLGGTDALLSMSEGVICDSYGNTEVLVGRLGFTPAAVKVLRTAQQQQDSWQTWEVSVARARLVVNSGW